MKVLAACLAVLAAAVGLAAPTLAAWTARTSTASTFAAASAFPPQVTSVPDVLGVAQSGQPLQATQGGFSPSPTSVAYAWLRCNSSGGSCASVASGSSYTVAGADVGSTIRVRVTPTNGSATGPAVMSEPTQVAKGAGLGPVLATPPASKTPTISGTPTVGQSLTVSNGTWSGVLPTFSRRWLRCNATGASCQAISGATGQGYTATSADLGLRLRARITATSLVGSNAVLTVDTAVIAAAAAGSR